MRADPEMAVQAPGRSLPLNCAPAARGGVLVCLHAVSVHCRQRPSVCCAGREDPGLAHGRSRVLAQACANPVTGSKWLRGVDPVESQKQTALRALIAREWFERTGPEDAPPLPLSYDKRESLKSGGLPHIVAWFARSIAANHYEIERHPSFEEYARGVLASPYAPDFIKEDEHLAHRFPPCLLKSLGPGLHWRPTTS